MLHCPGPQRYTAFLRMSSLYRRLSLWVRRHWRVLERARDTPHAVAGGVAIGVILGFTPFFGLKTVLAVAVAWMLRCSRVGAVVAVVLHDLTLPFAPLLLRWEYKIGRWILGLFGVEPPPPSHVHLLHWRELLDWRLLREGLWETLWPLFLGSLVIATPVAVLLYWMTLSAIKAYRRKKAVSRSTPRASE